jgi:uncharacterized OB-fold protein
MADRWQPDPISAPHWDALVEGHLLFQRCADCATPRLPPSDRCAACLGDRLSWEASAGRGRLISWTTFHRAYVPDHPQAPPYVVLLVALDEGPQLLGALAGKRGAELLRAGADVCFEPVAARGDVPVTAGFRLV